ncbi:MAG: hypothetical protein ACLTYN_02530 [Dysosmobacter welbionis]
MCFGSDDPNDPVLFDLDLVSKAAGLRFDYEETWRPSPPRALDEIFKVIQASKYIDENALGPGKGYGDQRQAAGPCAVQPAGGHPHLRHPTDALHAGEL